MRRFQGRPCGFSLRLSSFVKFCKAGVRINQQPGPDDASLTHHSLYYIGKKLAFLFVTASRSSSCGGQPLYLREILHVLDTNRRKDGAPSTVQIPTFAITHGRTGTCGANPLFPTRAFFLFFLQSPRGWLSRSRPLLLPLPSDKLTPA